MRNFQVMDDYLHLGTQEQSVHGRQKPIQFWTRLNDGWLVGVSSKVYTTKVCTNVVWYLSSAGV